MKIFLIILAFTINGCGFFYGQSPRAKIDSHGRIVSYYAVSNTVPYIGTDSCLVIDVTYAEYPFNSKQYKQLVDSVKFYWSKQVYWENKMNAELSRLDRSGHKNDISKALVRYQDSSVRYKILLDRLKK